MGRGGARAKASGGTLSGEGPLTTQTLSLNLTLFQFLQSGYFEKDLLSYCANRLAEYSCIYWLDPSVDDDTKGVELHTAAYQAESVGWTTPIDVEFTKYPSHFINRDRSKPTGVTVVHTLAEGQPITGTFLGPVNVREVLLSEHGTSIAVLESNRLPLDTVARIILPFLLLFACLSNLFVMRTAYRMSRRRLPLAIYFVYITILDQIDLLARGTDYLVEAYGGIRLFTAVQFLGRSACQLLPMMHSGLRHVHAALLIGFAIDTWRFTRNPQLYAAIYRREWTRNVLILAAVLAITIDSQFLWTFDLSQIETKTLHERLVKNLYECGFSVTTTLSPTFLYIIWPLIDHLWAELIPCVVCGSLGTLTLIVLRLRRRRKISTTAFRLDESKTHVQSDADVETTKKLNYLRTVVYRWFDGHTIHEAPKAFGLVVIIDCIFVIPRAIYYLTKYVMFANYHTNRAGSQFFAYDTQPDHPNLIAIGNTIRRVARLRPYEAPLESVEAIMRYLGCLHMIARAVVLVRNMTVLRRQLTTYWYAFQHLFRWGICCPDRIVTNAKKARVTSPTERRELDVMNKRKDQIVTNINDDAVRKHSRTDGNQLSHSTSGTRKRDRTGPRMLNTDKRPMTNKVSEQEFHTVIKDAPVLISTQMSEVVKVPNPRPMCDSKKPNILDGKRLTKQVYSL